MDLLLTNDDGVDAPGLAALESALAQFGRLHIVAPMQEQSMCGHRVTTRSPIRIQQRDTRRWAVDGTPADCVRLALHALEIRPAWVISGVNAGGNLGQDIVISGTVAAAREAAYHAVPAMAFSHYLIRELAVDWKRVSTWVTGLFAELSASSLTDGEFWNVNLPHHAPGALALPECIVCPPARSPLGVSFSVTEDGHLYSASYAKRPRDPGSDVEACFSGHVAISKLRV